MLHATAVSINFRVHDPNSGLTISPCRDTFRDPVGRIHSRSRRSSFRLHMFRPDWLYILIWFEICLLEVPMVKGTLTITFEPPALSFISDHVWKLKHCNREEIHAILSELGAERDQLGECFVRLTSDFPEALLKRFGLLPQLVPIATARRRYAT